MHIYMINGRLYTVTAMGLFSDKWDNQLTLEHVTSGRIIMEYSGVDCIETWNNPLEWATMCVNDLHSN